LSFRWSDASAGAVDGAPRPSS